MPWPAEEVEKKQKILLWLMEGQKEMAQQKRSPHGSVISYFKPEIALYWFKSDKCLT